MVLPFRYFVRYLTLILRGSSPYRLRGRNSNSELGVKGLDVLLPQERVRYSSVFSPRTTQNLVSLGVPALFSPRPTQPQYNSKGFVLDTLVGSAVSCH